MKLVFTMFLSIGIKGAAAIAEIVIQLLLTNYVGMTGYGEYIFFVSIIECLYWLFFSGSVKINTFYLSVPTLKIDGFKRSYITRYVVPFILVITTVLTVVKGSYGLLAAVILFVYFLAYDRSSVFFSRDYQLPALLGEYMIGRLVMLAGLFVCLKLGWINGLILLALYGVQFLTMLIWFVPFEKKLKSGTEEVTVPLKKIWDYQQSDIVLSIISYSPTILQYIFGGAFSAGFTGIIALVKKFLNFISGPMTKVFLPEFSRLYLAGDKEQIRKSYLMIVRIQMLFIGTIGAALLGFPHLILKLFSAELQPYAGPFTVAAACLLLIAGMGPVIGLLQMTGQERLCNRNQLISIGTMVAVWMILNKNPLFSVYALCVQAVVEGILEYYSVCKWFNGPVIPVHSYIIMWMPVALECFLVEALNLRYSFIALLVSMTLVGIWNLLFTLRDPLVKDAVAEALQKLRR